MFLKKGNSIALLIIIMLLAAQVFCDLKIPDYISSIVNVGIGQKGIKNAVPERVSKETDENIKMFLSGSDNKLYTSSYKKSGGVYKLNDGISEKKINKLSKILIPVEVNFILLSGKLPKSAEKFVDVKKLPTLKDIKLGYQNKIINKQKVISIKNSVYKNFTKIDMGLESTIFTRFIESEYKKVSYSLKDVQFSYMISDGLFMLIYALASFISAILSCYVASRLSANISNDLRKKSYSKILSFSEQEMGKFSSASLITRRTNDITQIQIAVVLILRIGLYAPILGVGAVFMIFSQHTGLNFIIPTGVVILITIFLIFYFLVAKKFEYLQVILDKLNLRAREIISGVSVIRAFGKQSYEDERFMDVNKEMYKTQIYTTTGMSIIMPLIMFLMNSISCIIVFFGADGISKGDLLVGDMIAFISYTMMIFMAFIMLSMIIIFVPRANASSKRVKEILDTDTVVKDIEKEKAQKISGIKSGIKFKNVSFKYSHATESVLSDISFEAKKGETIAIIGGTGSGKSTLVKLLPRLFDVTNGSIEIDGTDIRKFTLEKLRSLIGFATQKAILFSGTIKDNILFAKKEDKDHNIDEILKITKSEDFIKNRKKGVLDTVSEKGANFSGGQKQRLSIARTLAKESEILIFDDTFSALDFKTDYELRKNLSSNYKDKIVFIVAQRIATIMNADRIIMIDEGKVIGNGKHKELLKTNEYYKELALSQLSEKELKSA